MLQLEPADVAAHEVWVLDLDGIAVGFYRAMGGEEIGSTPSAAEPGRMLPRMCMRINLDQRGTRNR